MALKWKRIEVGLVLQGGGALGAYEWGAIEALFALMDEIEAQGTAVALKAVSGVSIGAVNGACVVGATDRQDGLRRLAALWNDLKLETPFSGRLDLEQFALPSISPARDLSLFGLPGFYSPRLDTWNAARWTSLYDTAPLEATLRKYISFADIDRSSTTFVVTAVDVESGVLTRFRNAPVSPDQQEKKPPSQRAHEHNQVVAFTPEHILASSSLAPQFPWTEIGGHIYWDGGIIDNTPLGDAMAAFSEDDETYRLMVVMNLYPLAGRRPRNLLEVTDRVHELSYGNRLRQDCSLAHQINKLVHTVEQLAQVIADANVQISPELMACVRDAFRYKIAKIVNVDFQAPTNGAAEDSINDSDGLRDFSVETIEGRHQRGRERAAAELTAVLAADGFVSRAAPQPAATPVET
jgi:predicted acylesterase/phospholipase RssA